jgi:hypothetical protein
VAVPPVAIQGVYQISFGYGLRDGVAWVAATSGGGGGGGLQAVPFVAAAVPLAGAAVRGFWIAAVFGLVTFLGLRALAGLEAALFGYAVLVAAVVAIMVLRL